MIYTKEYFRERENKLLKEERTDWSAITYRIYIYMWAAAGPMPPELPGERRVKEDDKESSSRRLSSLLCFPARYRPQCASLPQTRVCMYAASAVVLARATSHRIAVVIVVVGWRGMQPRTHLS
eukprot:GHVU01055038.1.p1 GENE.GHVU01055038.1~~GHVU01055038.1.p1  ORF type:complete len:123 (+),score=11.98 GHVU01055038.1:403-771(+)